MLNLFMQVLPIPIPLDSSLLETYGDLYLKFTTICISITGLVLLFLEGRDWDNGFKSYSIICTPLFFAISSAGPCGLWIVSKISLWIFVLSIVLAICVFTVGYLWGKYN